MPRINLEVAANTTADVTAPSPVASPLVLVVDDEASNRRTHCRYLERVGCRWLEVTDGDEVVPALADAAAHGDPVALVMMDIVMRRMNGELALVAMREAGFDMPCVAATGNASLADIERYTAAGFLTVLHKPFTATQLAAALRTALPPAAAAHLTNAPPAPAASHVGGGGGHGATRSRSGGAAGGGGGGGSGISGGGGGSGTSSSSSSYYVGGAGDGGGGGGDGHAGASNSFGGGGGGGSSSGAASSTSSSASASGVVASATTGRSGDAANDYEAAGAVGFGVPDELGGVDPTAYAAVTDLRLPGTSPGLHGAWRGGRASGGGGAAAGPGTPSLK